jgi:hypothetical protein
MLSLIYSFYIPYIPCRDWMCLRPDGRRGTMMPTCMHRSPYTSYHCRGRGKSFIYTYIHSYIHTSAEVDTLHITAGEGVRASYAYLTYTTHTHTYIDVYLIFVYILFIRYPYMLTPLLYIIPYISPLIYYPSYITPHTLSPIYLLYIACYML